MINLSGPVGYMNEFPDFHARGFDIDAYNNRFRTVNVIINAKSSDVSYPRHWGPLSVKCALGGREFYQAANATYGVDDDCFLILEQGRMYSSWIPAGGAVESFTVNITPSFQQDALAGFRKTALQLDSPHGTSAGAFTFAEQLYRHDNHVSPVLWAMRKLSREDVKCNGEHLHELFVLLMERLAGLQASISMEMLNVEKTRESTRVELYRRLVRARDFLYSTYEQAVDLQAAADVACLNQHYFLREFRRTFGFTPHQFLTKRRMEVAARMFAANDADVFDVCRAVGYADVTSFSKLFKRHMGMTPAAYKQEYRKV